MLNSIQPHETDPTLVKCRFIILDFEKSRNNVIVTEEVAMESLAPSIINKPIRGYYIEENENGESDFGGHELHSRENKDGKLVIERSTVPMGVFTSEGYVEEIMDNGKIKRVLVADAVLWYSQFKQPINLILDWFEQGITISMSCEYLYHNYEVKDGIERHLNPLYFEAHCILGREILPAYESAKIIDYSQLNEFKHLVAQAVKQSREKEDGTLDKKLENTELEVNEEIEETLDAKDSETEKEVENVVESTEDEYVENNSEEVSEESEKQLQVNELSHDDIRQQIREQVSAHITGETWVWVADVYETYTVVEVEFADEDYVSKYFKFNYTKNGDTLTVDLESMEEVKSKREWVAVTNELQVQLEKVKSEKDDLLAKFTEATDTIISLNTQIEQLKPYQEMALNAQREQKLTEQIEKYEVRFNAIGAQDVFKSEEVQELIANSINDSDEGKEALLKLNEILFNSIKVDKNSTQLQANSLAGIATKRDNKVDVFVDDFDTKYKY